MREIKFRAWDNRRNIYGEVLELHRPYKDGDLQFPDGHKGKVSLFNINNQQDCGFWGSWIEYVAIEQFTGLKDKNGKDIYEGDILETSESDDPAYSIIGYDGCAFCDNNGCLLEDIGLSWSTVVGNIHENPELIKETK